MPRHRLAPLAPLALSLAIAQAAQAASLTPPNLVTASSLASPDLLLVWPYASGGPLEAMSWATFTAQMQAAIGGAYLKPANNLSDLGNQTVARTNLGLPLGTSGAVLCYLSASCTWSGIQSFNDSTLLLKGSTSGSLLIRCAPVCGSGTLILPAGSTNFSSTGGTSQVVKQTTAGGALTVGRLACADLSDSGTGCTSSTSAVTGTLTPTLAYATPGTSSFSYGTQGGQYVCFGSNVTGWARISFTPTNGTGSGNLYWSNPPYAPVNAVISADVQFGPPAFFSSSGWSNLTTLSYGPALDGAQHIVFDNQSGSTVTTISATNSTSGSAKTISFYFTYITSSSC